MFSLRQVINPESVSCLRWRVASLGREPATKKIEHIGVVVVEIEEALEGVIDMVGNDVNFNLVEEEPFHPREQD